MNCSCHHELNRENASVHNGQPIVVPCDPDTLARLQAEYLPQTPPPEKPEPSQARTATQLVRDCRIKLKPGAELLLAEELSPQEYYGKLFEAGFLAEARRVLAHAMPKRRALWWACLCAQEAYQNDMPKSVTDAIDAVLRFVVDPSETNRRQAEHIGRGLPPNRLEGCLAMAAFFSGGSVSLPGLPAVPPRPYVTGRLVGVAVYLASVIRSPAHYKLHLRQYLELGAQIARGNNLWHQEQKTSNRLDAASTAPGPPAHHRRTPRGIIST